MLPWRFRGNGERRLRTSIQATAPICDSAQTMTPSAMVIAVIGDRLPVAGGANLGRILA